MIDSRNALTPEALSMMDAIARTGSFAAAARELGKVPSALTYNVRQLEDALDVLLFDRRSGQAKLTAAGEELLAEGRRVLLELDAVANRVKRVASGWESQLTVAVEGIVSRVTVLELCEAFFALPTAEGASHSTRLRLRTEMMAGTWDALLAGEADLSIGVTLDSVVTPAGLSMELLGEVPFVFAVAPQHPLALLEHPLEDSELMQHRAVAVADSTRRMAPLTFNLLAGQDVFTVASMHTKIEALVRGLGCGFVPEHLAHEHIRAGRLVVKKVMRNVRVVQLGYAWRTQATTQPKKAPQGLALTWWLTQLRSSTTRRALLSHHLSLPQKVD